MDQVGKNKSFFELIGGRETLEKVHKIFYDDIYADSWLKQYFSHVDQKMIEDQQTDFMSANMGGSKVYSGQLPKAAHKRIFVTNELFDFRSKMLLKAIKEVGVSDDLAERWIRIDDAFRSTLVKKSVEECEKRYISDIILDFKKPM